MPYEHIIAIDPGASGAAVFIDAGAAAVLDVVPYKGDDTIVSFFKSFVGLKNVAVVIEQVNGSPVQGAQSAFKFGDNFGSWRIAAKFAGFPVFGVRPQEWQKPFQITVQGPARKRTLRDLAAGLFPDEHVTLVTADALLLGHFALHNQKSRGVIGGKLV